jgi:uncharacterized protein (TIGR04255 family)
MPFPSYNRVIYTKNPLDKVICQLRFPTILRIETEIPAQFQELIRDAYPGYNEKSEIIFNKTYEIEQIAALNIFQDIQKPIITKNHEFVSDDGKCVINLNKNFLAISTTKYEMWETFLENILLPFNALIKIYSPKYFTRIGLRYIDIFQRSKLGLKDDNWENLLQPYILGLLASPIGSEVRNFENNYEISLHDSESFVKIATRLVELPNSIENEKCFVVDSDFFNFFKTDPPDVDKKLDFLHSRASNLIQWIIKEKLHFAMNPSEMKK